MTATVTPDTEGNQPLPRARVTARHGRRRNRLKVLAVQLFILVVLLAGWQYLPKINWLSSRFHILDAYFVSSPSLIASRLVDVAAGRNDSFTVWGYLWPTVYASLLGMVIGTALGGLAGLLLSNSATASAIVRPFIVAFNSIPRIALIPIAVIVFGPNVKASLALSILVVFFIVFWNAYEGGLSISTQIVQNATLLGASQWQKTIAIRMPYVFGWTFAALPNAVTFAFLSVVTTEVLSGVHGLGFLVSQSTATADSTLTFTVAVVLTVLGLAIVGTAEVLKRRILHWWHPEQR